MDKKTYEALKRIIVAEKQWSIPSKVAKRWGIKVNLNDIKLVEDWIDEVAKEYNYPH